jgi:hypothetical protein
MRFQTHGPKRESLSLPRALCLCVDKALFHNVQLEMELTFGNMLDA